MKKLKTLKLNCSKFLESAGEQCYSVRDRVLLKGELDYIILCIDVIAISFVRIFEKLQGQNWLFHQGTCSVPPVRKNECEF